MKNVIYTFVFAMLFVVGCGQETSNLEKSTKTTNVAAGVKPALPPGFPTEGGGYACCAGQWYAALVLGCAAVPTGGNSCHTFMGVKLCCPDYKCP